jgi:hypothetical protein
VLPWPAGRPSGAYCRRGPRSAKVELLLHVVAHVRAAQFARLRRLPVAHGHTVLAPDPGSDHLASPHDIALLLADLVRAVRFDDRVWLLDPFASPSVCLACLAAYREAWDALGAAGGVMAWLAEFERRPR